MFEPIACMSDGDRQWKVSIGRYETRDEAERDAYRFFMRYDGGWPSVLWIQIYDI